MLVALAMKVNGTVITSSPGPMLVAEQGQVQRRRPRAGGHRVLGADERGELLLELADARALGQRAGGHRLPHALLLLLAHLRAGDRYHVAGCLLWRRATPRLARVLSFEGRHDPLRGAPVAVQRGTRPCRGP